MSTVDSGVPDAGPAPQQFCVASSCNAAGTWRVTFAGDAGNLVCMPVDDQLKLTSDGGTVCMLRADDGATDGGCGLRFVIHWHQSGSETLDGTDTWDLGIPDAGHLYGTWSTHVTGISNCDGVFSIHGQR